MKFKCFSIGAHNSRGMLSDNANSGIYETDIGRCLDLNGGNPACNQGGVVVLASVGEAKQRNERVRENDRALQNRDGEIHD